MQMQMQDASSKYAFLYILYSSMIDDRLTLCILSVSRDRPDRGNLHVTGIHTFILKRLTVECAVLDCINSYFCKRRLSIAYFKPYVIAPTPLPLSVISLPLHPLDPKGFYKNP